MEEVANQASNYEKSNQALKPEVQGQVSREKAYLDRVEALRLQQECTHDLDLRQYVTEPRKRYRYRRRVYWLDADSRKLFHEGLERDGGVFTVATCEAILASASLKADQCLPQWPVSASSVTASLAAKLKTKGTSVHNLHDVLKLGYFEKRRQDRIKYTTRTLLIGDGSILPGRTRDISETGIKVRTSSTGSFLEGDTVTVKFPDLPGIRDELVRYRLIRVVQKLSEYSFSLHCEDGRSGLVIASVRSLSENQGDGHEGQLGLDAEDAALTAESLLAERHYMHSMASIPLFIARDGLNLSLIHI